LFLKATHVSHCKTSRLYIPSDYLPQEIANDFHTALLRTFLNGTFLPFGQIENKAIRVRFFAPTEPFLLSLWNNVKNLGDRASIFVEKFGRVVRRQPRGKQGQLFCVLLNCRERNLVGVERAFDNLIVE
jgi:hypothetical protein